jgi:hypothetical protein
VSGAYRPFEFDDAVPAPVPDALDWLDRAFDLLWGGAFEGLPRLGPGSCDECGEPQRRRYLYAGRLELCRRHVSSRRRARLQLPPCRRLKDSA